jgi:hypothetical protein
MVKPVNLTYSFSKTLVVAAMTMIVISLASTSFGSVYAQDVPPAGTLSVISHVINNNGGTKQASDFSNCIDSSGEGSTSMQCSSGQDQGISESSFDPGPYKVIQDPSNSVDGYTFSYSPDCSGTLNAGERKICTITYDDVAPPSPSS